MTSKRMTDVGLLTLRAGLGAVLVAHGGQKLFGWFGGHGVEGTAGAFETMGFRPGRASAVAAGLGEAGGGALITLGLATPAACAAATGTMIPAASVHAPQGFFAAGGGLEYPALLGVSSAALALIGPGDMSLDAMLGHRLNRPWMAALSLIASCAASAYVVMKRQQALRSGGGITAAQAPADSPQTPAAAPPGAAGSDATSASLEASTPTPG